MDKAMAQKSIEDIYPLSPMQSGMLFHTLKEPGAGVYVEQLRFTLEPLDATLFHLAWEEMFARFPALRTSIAGTGRKEPVQVVRSQVELPWRTYDCRTLSPAGQRQWLADYLEEDRIRGFKLDEPSLVRLMLIRLTEERYELVWTLHHIALDGWSGALIQRDLFTTYATLQRGERPILPPVPPFRNYISWLARQDVTAAESYWRGALQGFTVPTVIDSHRPEHNPSPPSDYAQASLQLTSAFCDTLRAYAGVNRITLNTLFQAAWGLLLAHYSNTDDILFGAVVSGRPELLDGIDQMVGMLVNTLPVRLRIPWGKSAQNWLAELQASQFEQRQYAYSPLWQIQKWSEMPGKTQLFETLFVFENIPVVAMHPDPANGLAVEFTPPFDRTGYPLMLLIVPRQEIALRITYDPGRFGQAMIRRMLGHLECLLHSLVSATAQPLSAIQWIGDAERTHLLVGPNQTTRPYPSDICLHHLFEAQVDRQPDAQAVTFGSEHLTYRQLDDRANQLAHYLQILGVGPDVPVALCLRRSLDVIVAVLGVLKAGGAYLPIDPDHPVEWLSYILDNGAAPVIVTHPQAVASLPPADTLPTPPAFICLEQDAQTIADMPVSRPSSPVEPHHLLYILYTSGSTGRPKGVVMPHAPLVNLVHWQLGESALGSGQRTLQFAPLGFDVSCQEIFATLGAGGTLCLIDEEQRRDPSALLRMIEEESMARLFLPFVALQQLADAARSYQRFPASLRQIITAGEQLQITPALIEFFQHLGDQSVLVNQYGPTECHVVSSFSLNGPPGQWPQLPPIGRPIANTQIYLLDSTRQPVPVGVPGELYIGGVAVGRGYWKDKVKTEDRFVDDPFSVLPAARLYRTGDLGRYTENGDIEFLGRIDRQVKIRGFRIEPGEIEGALREHPAVRDGVVDVLDTDVFGKRIVAWWIGQAEYEVDSASLRDFLRQRLPEYMLPAAFVPVAAFPLTPNGKIDLRQLPRPEMETQLVPPSSPRTALERQLLTIWQQVLGRKNLGVEDDFFDAGGHSLLAVRLMFQVSQAIGQEMPVSSIFYGPTIRQQAALAEQKGWSPPWVSLVPVQPGGTRPPLFLVPPAGATGIRMAYLAHAFGPDQPVYSFDPGGLDERSPIHTSVEEAAAHFVRELRQFQPNGPYLLGGMCFGGHVAYEMAQQLNGDAPTVLLLDASQPLNGPCWSLPPRDLFYFWHRLRDYRRGGYHWVATYRYFRSRWYRLWQKIRHWSSADLKRMEMIFSHQLPAMRNYRARPTTSHLILFQSDEPMVQSRQTGWKELSDNLEIIHFPNTTHHSLLLEDENVGRIADRLREVIDRWRDMYGPEQNS